MNDANPSGLINHDKKAPPLDPPPTASPSVIQDGSCPIIGSHLRLPGKDGNIGWDSVGTQVQRAPPLARLSLQTGPAVTQDDALQRTTHAHKAIWPHQSRREPRPQARPLQSNGCHSRLCRITSAVPLHNSSHPRPLPASSQQDGVMVGGAL